jgi:(1->4)-alpha-D-glucan 1-alpha-D-glucosylmutase
MLLLAYPPSASEADRAAQRRFVGKFQQVTAPVMAKGLEDTTFYVYTRLLSLNEVGNDADRFGVSPEDLHHTCEERQAKWPWALSALSTHDTKRSEDVRARLNVLSELPEEWQACLQRWSDLNAQYRVLDDEPVPDASVEYLLYQTLLGAWPLEPYSAGEYGTFVERIQAYMMKALHEAKVYTSWINPNPAYDEAVQQYVARILDPQANQAFLDDFRAFQRRVSHCGLFNSLSQTLLKLTAPGVPDTYQGTEMWDFSLVDPDNRRPVDYAYRHRMLQALQARMTDARDDRIALARELLTSKEDGRIKLYVTTLALSCRRTHSGLFATGGYLPAQAKGAKREHVFGFVRRQGDRTALVVVPRFVARLLQDGHAAPLGEAVWQDTTLLVPGPHRHRGWRNVLTGAPILAAEDGQTTLAMAELFAHFPVALLVQSSHD